MTSAPLLPVDAVDAIALKTGLGGATAGYLLRHLRFTDSKGDSRQVDESEMLATTGPKIVLGEPGMGKSELMRAAGRRLEVTPITARRFMLSKDPAQFVVPGKQLMIDGLDEAMARREGDAVDMILAQLEAAGLPEFILSCRTREWQARSVTNVRQILRCRSRHFCTRAVEPGGSQGLSDPEFCKGEFGPCARSPRQAWSGRAVSEPAHALADGASCRERYASTVDTRSSVRAGLYANLAGA